MNLELASISWTFGASPNILLAALCQAKKDPCFAVLQSSQVFGSLSEAKARFSASSLAWL